ncbi:MULTISPECIES: LuxR C-terminal-related transcriptional regulator [unclassified Novosphingobium]|uniref:LuxR C-terminal-related transcriptional regulator n=1 Tax=unclassified Novosphingobium TaxID=2644732 RepID=UPI00146A5EA8|nr:LuxR family maltose regulon positive regulatory protein [Novosphingobium sp. SG919]NMN85224.1 LuxR family maltose regulon positive regulatory protein [Novosphingobium sp. SG916]
MPICGDVRLARFADLLATDGRERIVQVFGPTGLGKTTLLANHVRGPAAGAASFRWLTLRAGDLGDGGAFEWAIAQAVGACGDLPTADAIGQVLAGLNGRPLILVIDANALDVEPVGQALGQLLLWTPERFKVWLVSRRPCAALLAQVRSPHLTRSLDPAQFLFDPAEAAAYAAMHLAARPGTGVASGWPLAEAVATDIDGPCSVETVLDHAGGLLEAAMREGIWQALSVDAKLALTQTAMLEWVDERYLGRLLAPRLAFPVLMELGQLAPLISVRRGVDGGFSANALLRGFARRELDKGKPADRAQAYREALHYHVERRAPDAAMALVRDCGDQALARLAFEAFTSGELLGASGYTRVRDTLSQLLPDFAEQPQAAQSGQVTITQAVMLMKEGHFPEARRLLDAAREYVTEELAYQSPSQSRVYADFIIAQHVLAFHSHTQLTEAQLAEGFFWSTYTNDRINAAFVYALRSLHYFRQGRFALAQEQIEASCRKYESATAHYGLGSAMLVDAMIALAQGKLSRASRLATEAGAMFARTLPDDVGLRAVGECVLCEVELERGRTEGLFDRIDAALRDLEAHDGWPDAFVIGYRVGARAALMHNDHARALELLDRAMRLMRGRRLGDIEHFCRILHAGVVADRRQGRDLVPALADTIATSRVGWRARDEAALLQAQDALLGKDAEALRAVADRLERQALDSGRAVTTIRVFVIQALGLFDQDRVEAAAERLYEAIVMAQPEGIVLPFAEQGPALLPVVDAMKTVPAYRAAGRGVRSFCAGVVRTVAAHAFDASGGIAFAPRELSVLRGIALRHSTKVIARDLGLSASAVKFHLGNIYRKLGVNKRSAAVAEALRRRLI